jgi:hypothetical protein
VPPPGGGAPGNAAKLFEGLYDGPGPTRGPQGRQDALLAQLGRIDGAPMPRPDSDSPFTGLADLEEEERERRDARAVDALRTASPDDLAALRARAATDPEVAKLLAGRAGDVERIENEARKANETLEATPDDVWTRLNVPKGDLSALATLSPKQINEEIARGGLDREATLNALTRAGYNDGKLRMLNLISDPEREDKEAGRQAGLIEEFINTDLHGARASAGSMFEGDEEGKQANRGQLLALQIEVRAMRQSGTLTKDAIDGYWKRYRALELKSSQQFNSRMDNLTTATEVATVVKDVLKDGAKFLAKRALGKLGESAMGFVLDTAENTANLAILENVPLGAALGHGALGAAATTADGLLGGGDGEE